MTFSQTDEMSKTNLCAFKHGNNVSYYPLLNARSYYRMNVVCLWQPEWVGDSIMNRNVMINFIYLFR